MTLTRTDDLLTDTAEVSVSGQLPVLPSDAQRLQTMGRELVQARAEILQLQRQRHLSHEEAQASAGLSTSAWEDVETITQLLEALGRSRALKLMSVVSPRARTDVMQALTIARRLSQL